MASTSSGSTSTAAPPADLLGARCRATSRPACPAPSPRAPAGRSPRAGSGRRRPSAPAYRARSSVGRARSRAARTARRAGQRRAARPSRSGRPDQPRSRASARTRSNAASRRAQVLAGLERADEQHVGPVEAVALRGRGHLVGRGRHRRRTPERHEPQPASADAVRRDVAPASPSTSTAPGRRRGRTSSRPRRKNRRPRGREVVGLVEEGEVVHRHDERRRAGRDDERGGVDDVDRAGRPLHRGRRRRVPRLVERGPRQRELAHRHDGRNAAGRRRLAVARRATPDELDVAAAVQRRRPARGRPPRCRRAPVPALLEGDGQRARPTILAGARARRSDARHR